MNQEVAWALQGLILATGIYLALRFLRTTRGGGVLRGLAVAVLLLVFGLWGLAKLLVLEELDHILQSVSGYLVVILAILFQPELRRGITHLGDHPLLGRLVPSKRADPVIEVVQAVLSMASRQRGALIAFERELSLEAYMENAVRVDSEVGRLILESIFHPGSALHDGAVVLRDGRVAAATCLFPLTENIEIAKSTGTRHRAALGLTEETDAIAVTVSEETGGISIACRGQMIRDIPPLQFEERLRATLESGQASAGVAPASDARPFNLAHFLRDLFTRDLLRKAGACALAGAMLYLSHQDISITRDFSLRMTASGPTPGGRSHLGELALVLPGDDYHLLSPAAGAMFEITVTGTRAQLDELGVGLGGQLSINRGLAEAGGELPIKAVRWSTGDWSEGVGLRARWKSSPTPKLEVGRFGRRRLELGPEQVELDRSQLNPRYEIDTDGLSFNPTSVDVVGPLRLIPLLGTQELPFRLEPLALDPTDSTDRHERLGLARELASQGFSLADGETVNVTLELVPAEVLVGELEQEIALVCLNASASYTLSNWSVSEPSRIARFRILAQGLIPKADPGSPAHVERTSAIQEFVRRHLRVFVDLADLPQNAGATGGTVPVHLTFSRDWRQSLDLPEVAVDARADLHVELVSETSVLLMGREPGESGVAPTGLYPTTPPSPTVTPD
ncbi:MAG TPA: diadenylate cyclase [Planctomycetota bacterium]|nr:diadenylate cyclase [Planctomycetota bacterium]